MAVDDDDNEVDGDGATGNDASSRLRTMRKGGVNSPRDAAVGEQFWRAEVVCDAPPPLRETDVTEGGMGGGGAVALLVPLSSAIVDGLSHVFREEI
jgi:hypothetical protein